MWHKIRLIWPALMLLALLCVVVEFLFGVETCPIRDWAMQMANMSSHLHCDHQCKEK